MVIKKQDYSETAQDKKSFVQGTLKMAVGPDVALRLDGVEHPVDRVFQLMEIIIGPLSQGLPGPFRDVSEKF